jgi:branched-subunit amino acid transport protein
MQQDTMIYLTIAGMMLVTFLPRVAPVWFLASRSLPPLVASWLRYVPPAVLAAMLLPSIVAPDGVVDLHWSNLYLMAAVPTLLVAWKTRSMVGSVLTGMVLVALARLVWGM